MMGFRRGQWMYRGIGITASVAALLATGAGSANAQFTLWQIAGAPNYQTPDPQGVSSDGSRVVGSLYGYTQYTDRAFEWTPGTGTVLAPNPATAIQSRYFGISDDGSTRVGTFTDGNFWEYGIRQTPPGTAQDLGNLGYRYVSAQAVSADGSVVVGWTPMNPFLPTTSLNAFHWTQATGMISLGALPGQGWSEAHDVSGDGSVVVGTSNYGQGQSFRWTQATGMQRIPTLNDSNLAGHRGTAEAVSANGQVIIGYSTSTSTSKVEAYRWTETGGTVGLGLLSALGDQSETLAWDVNSDGTAIVGRAGNSNGSIYKATLWNPNIGTVDLKEYLLGAFGAGELPSDLAQWNLQDARAISADGTTITGKGVAPDGREAAWVLRYAGGFQNLGGRVSAAAPEPGTVGLLALALPVWAIARRRK